MYTCAFMYVHYILVGCFFRQSSIFSYHLLFLMLNKLMMCLKKFNIFMSLFHFNMWCKNIVSVQSNAKLPQLFLLPSGL